MDEKDKEIGRDEMCVRANRFGCVLVWWRVCGSSYHQILCDLTMNRLTCNRIEDDERRRRE